MSEVQNNGGNGHPQTEWILKPRAEWIAKRREEATKSGDQNFSQMHYARKGIVTEEMIFVAEREHITPELVRDEVAGMYARDETTREFAQRMRSPNLRPDGI